MISTDIFQNPLYGKNMFLTDKHIIHMSKQREHLQ